MGDGEANAEETVDVARLVVLVRQGDAGAYEILMRRHFRAAFAVARAHTGSEADAEDVCQAAFFRAYRRIGDCERPERFGAWLLRIVRNQAVNWRERERVRSAAPLEEAGDVRAAPGEVPDERLARRELRRVLTEALRTLAPVEREVIVLHDVEGYTHGEIARMLEISETMSRRRLSDGRRRLRQRLAQEREGGGGAR